MFELVEIIKDKKKKATSQVETKNNDYKISDKKSKILNTYKDEIIDSYKKYESAKVVKYKNRLKEIATLSNLWKSKRCKLCNANLRLRRSDYGDFWGCPNYENNNGTHSTFSANYDDELNDKKLACRVPIGAEWLTDILKETNLQQKIKAKELLFYFNQNGYEDLRIKHKFERTTLDRISGYVKANQASREEENIVFDYFKKVFKNCERKIQIKYKRANEKIRRVYLDLIVSNETTVYILEIKRGCLDTKEEQLNLYFDLIYYLLKSKNDKRKCYAIFLVFNNEDFPSSFITHKMLYFDEVNCIDNRLELEKKLRQNAYRY